MKIVSICALAFCFALLFVHFVRLVRLGKPKDLSIKSGDVGKGIAYSNTIAMMPNQKESAYMHLPTYAAGIAFHCGTFLSFLLYILSLFNLNQYYPEWLNLLLAMCLCVSVLCGLMMLVKRLANRNLRALANPDDYLANFFTTIFQCATIIYLLFAECCNATPIIYYVCCSILFVYMPFSKLKHLLYYFSARYHLGFFYGWRNVWPPKKGE